MMMEEEQMMKDQRERRVQIQQEIQQEPVRNQLERVQQEMENQQFYMNQQQPRYQPMVQGEDRQAMMIIKMLIRW